METLRFEAMTYLAGVNEEMELEPGLAHPQGSAPTAPGCPFPRESYSPSSAKDGMLTEDCWAEQFQTRQGLQTKTHRSKHDHISSA